MGRINVSITDEFRDAVKAYAKEYHLTESAALVELAAIGLRQKTGQTLTSMMRAHGGSPDRAIISPPTPPALAIIPQPEVNPARYGASVTVETKRKKAETPADKSSVMPDLDKATADLIRVFLFAFSEDKRGLMGYNVYTKSYKGDRPALNALLKQGYIEIIEKRYEKVIYRLTEKGKNYKRP